MPVILQPEDEELWLDASRTSFAQSRSLLKPLPEELMDAHDVSPIVNSAKYDGPECIQRVSDDEIPSGRQLSLL
jgi:putative SOS response-associated peptidase YedK